MDDGCHERGECVDGESEHAAGCSVEAAVVLDHAVDAFDGVAACVVGCPGGGAVGVSLMVVELFDAEGNHAVAAVFAVGDGRFGQLGVYAPGEEPTVRRRPLPGALAFRFRAPVLAVCVQAWPV